MDIEGAEYQVLLDLENLLKFRIMIVEFHSKFYYIQMVLNKLKV